MLAVGYRIGALDNDSYMYRTWKTAVRCPVCGTVLDHTALNPDFKLRRDVYDVSYTQDGACIVSELVKRVLSAYEGVDLDRLPHDGGFYLLNVARVVRFDSVRRQTRFENFCDGCERFRQVAGATPAFLRGVHKQLPAGIYRTDIEFGSDDERSPLLIVSGDLRDVLNREARKGLFFEEVHGENGRAA